MVEKVKDAASMLWLNLDEHERRLLVYGILWLAGTAYLWVAQEAKEREKRSFKGAVLAEIRHELGLVKELD